MSLFPPSPWQIYLEHPEGPNLLAEYFVAIQREAESLPPGFHQCELRQRLLADARTREVACRLAEIAGGLDDGKGRSGRPSEEAGIFLDYC